MKSIFACELLMIFNYDLNPHFANTLLAVVQIIC